MAKEKEKKASKAAPDPKDANVKNVITVLEIQMTHFNNIEGITSNLTPIERRRLSGTGVRNNGFIDKAFDIAHENPDFLPPNFSLADLTYRMQDLEDLRQLVWVLQQFLQTATDAMFVQADVCYREALRIYGSLQEQSRNRVTGARPLFEALRAFFSRRRRDPTEEPTEVQIERDVKRLLHGKADGEIVIKNETPHTQGGVHEVIDDVHKGRSVLKGTVEESIEE